MLFQHSRVPIVRLETSFNLTTNCLICACLLAMCMLVHISMTFIQLGLMLILLVYLLGFFCYFFWVFFIIRQSTFIPADFDIKCIRKITINCTVPLIIQYFILYCKGSIVILKTQYNALHSIRHICVCFLSFLNITTSNFFWFMCPYPQTYY